MQRFAKEVWQKYLNDGQMQDVMETLMGAGIAAGGQALLTDMSAEEIALSSGLGIGAALAARPISARIGYAAGRQLDKRIPSHMVDEYFSDPFTASFGLGHPASIKTLEKTLPKGEMKDITLAVHRAKHNQNFVKPDGTLRGGTEGILGAYARQYGDNIAQGLVALGTPAILDSMGIESYEQQQADKLRAELAALEGK